MSKGLGKAERFVLERLEAAGEAAKPWERWRPVPAFAQAYAGGAGVTTAQAETIRRAVRSLHRKGLIEAGDDGASTGYVRLPLDESAKKAEQRERERRDAQIEAWRRDETDQYPLPLIRTR